LPNAKKFLQNATKSSNNVFISFAIPIILPFQEKSTPKQ